MEYTELYSHVYCDKCNRKIAEENIIWDHDYDYDGNDRIHNYGKYTCQHCQYSNTFPTNDPYEDEE